MNACRLHADCPVAIRSVFEAFANVYRFACDDMVKRAAGQSFNGAMIYPNVYDGVGDVLHSTVRQQ